MDGYTTDNGNYALEFCWSTEEVAYVRGNYRRAGFRLIRVKQTLSPGGARVWKLEAWR
jgi:hypothetical protein